MASRSLGTLTLDLVAKTGGFVAGMDKAERETEKWKRKVKRNIDEVSRTLKIGLVAGATAAAAGLTVLYKKSSEAIDRQAKLAQQLNTTSESMATLKRAGDLSGISIEQIGTAARTLDVNLGKAAQGIGAQARALEKLGLSADDFVGLTLDDKINKINRALLENVDVTERAAVAADLFGTRNASAIQQLSPDVIAQAARETELFGLALSDVDAAKVEQANDAFSTFGVAIEGVSQQLTVAMAPAIRAIGIEFLDAAEEAGGFGNVTVNAMDAVVGAISFVINGADGIKRAFVITAETIAAAFAKLNQEVRESLASTLQAADLIIPGDAFSDTIYQLRSEARAFGQEVEDSFQAIRNAIEAPPAGNELQRAYRDAKIEAQQAAEAAVAARQAISGGGTPDAIAAATGETPGGGADRSYLLQPVQSYKAAALRDKTLAKIEEDRRKYQERERDETQDHVSQLLDIESQRLSSAEDLFGSLSGLTRQFAGENSVAYKAIFAAEKGAAIARSIVAIQTALAQASAAGPFPANLAAMASVAAATASIISTISSTAIGQAHDGLMSVPRTGTYLLERGERVTTADTSKKLDRTLDDVQRGGAGGIRIVNAFDSKQVVGDYMGSSDGERVVMNIVRRNAQTIRSLSV